jgi:hypothetical protein
VIGLLKSLYLPDVGDREAVHAGLAMLFFETSSCGCSSGDCLWICRNDNKNYAFLWRCLTLWLLMVICPLHVLFSLSCLSNVEYVFLSGLLTVRKMLLVHNNMLYIQCHTLG